MLDSNTEEGDRSRCVFDSFVLPEAPVVQAAWMDDGWLISVKDAPRREEGRNRTCLQTATNQRHIM